MKIPPGMQNFLQFMSQIVEGGPPILFCTETGMANIGIATPATYEAAQNGEEDSIEVAREHRLVEEAVAAAHEGDYAPLYVLIPALSPCGKWALGMHLAALISAEAPKLLGVCDRPEYPNQKFFVLLVTANYKEGRELHEVSHPILDAVRPGMTAQEGLKKFDEAARAIYAKVVAKHDDWADTIGDL